MSETNDPNEAANQPREGLHDIGNRVKEAARQKYEDLRDRASSYYESGRERAKQWEQSIEGYVQEKPVKSLLIAAGVGFLLGAIWKRR